MNQTETIITIAVLTILALIIQRGYIKKIGWFIAGRCKFCGGETWDWDSKKSYCHRCDKKQ